MQIWHHNELLRLYHALVLGHVDESMVLNAIKWSSRSDLDTWFQRKDILVEIEEFILSILVILRTTYQIVPYLDEAVIVVDVPIVHLVEP
jgi:hypothetical protein